MTELKVKLHPAESFINFMVNTKLYIRGERGKNWEEAEALRRELFHQLVPFFNRIVAEEREACAQLCEAWADENAGSIWDVAEAEAFMGRQLAKAIRKRGSND